MGKRKGGEKRKRRKKLEEIKKQLWENKDELLEYMRQDWDQVEREAKREELVRRAKEGSKKTGEVLLKFVAVSGVCFVALVMPNVFVAIHGLQRQAKGRGRKAYLNRKEARQKMYYLQRRGYIKTEKISDSEYKMAITDKGLEQALKQGFDAIKSRNTKWDGSWRFVFFDIPEKHKLAREAFRERLKHLGFYQVQKSVFANPYSCEKEIALITNLLNVTEYVTVLHTKNIDKETETKLKRHFFEG